MAVIVTVTYYFLFVIMDVLKAAGNWRDLHSDSCFMAGRYLVRASHLDVCRCLIGQCCEKNLCKIIDRIKADNIKSLVNNRII